MPFRPTQDLLPPCAEKVEEPPKHTQPDQPPHEMETPPKTPKQEVVLHTADGLPGQPPKGKVPHDVAVPATLDWASNVENVIVNALSQSPSVSSLLSGLVSALWPNNPDFDV
ncbi:hypothetical protein AA313_de0200335 [Arthrobotrys entomopaga]|nr:hypothetical protein AA313_de0200335 [Arthrobotrys entomopaga]